MKTRNIYLIVWLMLMACTAQAQLTCEGCGTPDPLIPVNGGEYKKDIVLTKDAVFTIVGSGHFQLSGVISETGGSYGIRLNAPTGKLILSGKNTYTGTTYIDKGELESANPGAQFGKTEVGEKGILSVGSSGNPESANLQSLMFAAQSTRLKVYSSGTTLSLVKLGEDGKGEFTADQGGTIDIMNQLTLPDGDYPIIQGKTKEPIPEFKIGINNSDRTDGDGNSQAYCIKVIQKPDGIYLRLVRGAVITGPVAPVCSGDIVTLTATDKDINNDTPGRWTKTWGLGEVLETKVTPPKDDSSVGVSEAKVKCEKDWLVLSFSIKGRGCTRTVDYSFQVRLKPGIDLMPPVHSGVATGVDLQHNPASTDIRFNSGFSETTLPEITTVTWEVSKKQTEEGDKAHIQISKDGSTLEEIPTEGVGKVVSDKLEAGPSLVYKLTANEGAAATLIFKLTPKHTLNEKTCVGETKTITVNVAGYEIPVDIGGFEKTSKTPNENPAIVLCNGSETNIRVGKRGDGILYQWRSDADNGVEGNKVRLYRDVAATIKDRLTLSKKHSASVVYYITALKDGVIGATVRLPVVVSPIPTITTTLDKSSISNNTAVSFELATDIEEAEADKVTYTWTVPENKVGAISESTPVKKIPQQTLTHTAATDESVIYSFIPTYTHAGVACAGAAVTAEVLVQGATVVIKEAADKTTGDIATDRGISVYPVPAKDQVTISSQYELTWIAVRDMSGKNVMRTEANGYEKSISVSTLPVGLYILEIINSSGVKRIKIIKE